MADYGLTSAMKDSLRLNTVELVNNLENIPAIMDHLIEDNIFHESEEVLYLPKRKDRVRKLLEYINKRPAQNYWTFIRCLFHPTVRQGHMAEKILTKLEEHGGQVTDDTVRTLRRDCLDIESMQPLSAQPLPPALHHHQDRPQKSAASDFHLSTDQDGGAMRTETGFPLSHDGENANMETDASSGLNKYEQEKNADKAYTMESHPRGQALIIDNEDFEHLNQRQHTDRDRDKLIYLFEHHLGFVIDVKKNLTGQEMRDELKSFSGNLSATCDSCMVAILTHGANAGVLFGTDGQLCNISSHPLTNTFITIDELRDIFSTSKCPAMRGKPKMMIIQACKGGLEDTSVGQRLHRDVSLETIPQQLEENRISNFERQDPDRADTVFLEATVENYVAYRNYFIEFLDTVFRQSAHLEHVMDMHAQIAKLMAERRPNGNIFTISEGKTTLRKKWYLNPPHVTT